MGLLGNYFYFVLFPFKIKKENLVFSEFQELKPN